MKKHLSTWFLSLVFFSQNLATLAALAASTKTQDSWQETGLDYKTVKEFINNASCNRVWETQIGCIQAVNALLELNEPVSLTLVPSTLAKTNYKASFASLKKELKPFLIYSTQAVKIPSLVDENEAFVQWYQKDQKENKIIFNEWQNTAKKFDFETLFSWTLKNVKHSLSEAQASAHMINRYLDASNDPHTRIEPKKVTETYETPSKNQPDLVGVGIQVAKLKDHYYIKEVISDSPAEKALIKAGAMIVKINQSNAESLKISELTQKVRGPEGTSVTLTLQNPGDPKPQTVDLVRAKVFYRNVKTALINYGNKKIAYLKVSNFIDNSTCFDATSAMLQLLKKNPQGVALDLRDNPGGKLGQAICLASLFLKKGQAVFRLDPIWLKFDETEDDFANFVTTHEDALTQLPLVVLTNANSASASEVVAGALQDHQRAWIVGERTFGKGSAQDKINFYYNPKINFFETRFIYYLPSGRTTQLTGVYPDFETFQNPQPSAYEKFALREEDLYLNPIASFNKKSWLQPRGLQVKAIQDCVAKTGSAVSKYQQLKDPNPFQLDYVLSVSQDVLSCVMSP